MNKHYVSLVTFVEQLRNVSRTHENAPTRSVRAELGKAYENAEMIAYRGDKKANA